MTERQKAKDSLWPVLYVSPSGRIYREPNHQNLSYRSKKMNDDEDFPETLAKKYVSPNVQEDNDGSEPVFAAANEIDTPTTTTPDAVEALTNARNSVNSVLVYGDSVRTAEEVSRAIIEQLEREGFTISRTGLESELSIYRVNDKSGVYANRSKEED